MAQWIDSYKYLDEAILDATKRTVEKKLIESEIHNAWQTGGIEAVKQVAERYGVRASASINYAPNKSYIPFWNVEKIATNEGVTTLYQNSLTIDVAQSIDDKIILKTVPEKVTTNLGKGCVTNAVKFASVVGAIATGIGLGVKSYKDNPAMWSELSDAIFELNGSEFFNVLSREYNGQYKTFIREQDVANVIKSFTYKDVFNVSSIVSKIPSDAPVNTRIDVTFASVGLPESPAGVFGYNYFLSLAPTHKILGYQNYVNENNEEVLFIYSHDNDTLPSQSILKIDTNNNFYTEISDCRFYLIKVDLTTGSLKAQYSDIRTGTVYSGYNIIIGSNYNTYTVGGLNSEVINKKGNNPIFYYPENTNALDNITSNMSTSDILDKLKSKYKDWFDDNFDITGYDPSKREFISENYVPIALPTQDVMNENITDPDYTQDYAQKGIPKQDNSFQTQTLLNNPPIDEPVPTPDDTPIDSGGGIIGGSGVNGLWSVYNPTKNELNNLGSYLWSSDIIDILQKFLNNPMDCIISLHLIYGTPTTNGTQNIKLGYLDSGVSSKIVSEQFINIDCGDIFINEYYGDSRDYEDIYTDVECFLPFIGFVKLKSCDIINSNVNIKYIIDVLSGVITCKIYVTKNGATQLLYTYSGNCSIQIPLTASDRTRLISGAIAGATTGFATGGVAGAIIGASVGSYMGGSNISKSGSFNGNSGALNVKIPYILITRKIPYDALYYNKFYGYPSNETVTLSSCKGFTKIKETHVENISRATDKEKIEIENLLKNGVLI